MGAATAPSSLPIKSHPPHSRVRVTFRGLYLSGRAQTESSVLALTIPSAFFAAVDTQSTNSPEPTGLTDFIRRDLLRISRGFAVILLAMYAPSRPAHAVVLILTKLIHSYISSRVYLHDPPGEDDDSMPHPEIPLEALRKERELAEAEPDVNPWACIALLVFTVGLMGVTAEFVRLPTSLLTHRNITHQRRIGSILILISPLPAARRQYTVRSKCIQYPRRVCALSPRSHPYLYKRAHPLSLYPISQVVRHCSPPHCVLLRRRRCRHRVLHPFQFATVLHSAGEARPSRGGSRD